MKKGIIKIGAVMNLPPGTFRLTAVLLPVVVLVYASSGYGAEQANQIEGRDVLATQDSIQFGQFRLRSSDSESAVFLVQQDDERRVRPDDLVWWNGGTAANHYSKMILRDGSVLAGNFRILNSQSVRWTSPVWQPIDVPIERVRHICFQVPAAAKRKKQLDLWLTQPSVTSRLLTSSGDTVPGHLFDGTTPRSKPYLAWNPLASSALQNEDPVQPIDVPIDRIVAISFAEKSTTASSAPTKSRRLQYDFRDGTTLQLSSIDFRGSVATVALGDWSLRLARHDNREKAVDQVCGIRNLAFDRQYVSRLSPQKYSHQPLIGIPQPLRVDRDNYFQPFAVHGFFTPFGLEMTSRSSVVFEVDNRGEESCFQCLLDLKSDQHSGKVICKILSLDADDQWNTVWSNDTIDSRIQTIPIHLKIGQSRAVALAVDYADDTDIGDRARWLMPRLFQSR